MLGPGAGGVGYLVTVVSFEGAGRASARFDTRYGLDVANGLAGRADERPGRDQQLELVSSSMSVPVAVRFPDGRVLELTPDVPVGWTPGGPNG